MINAVLFDLDNTLIDRNQAFHKAVNAQFHDQSLQTQFDALDHGGYGNRTALFDFWKRHTGTPMNQTLFGQLLAKHLQPDPQLLHILGKLSRIVKLGIITNGGRETQQQKIGASGLDEVIPAEWIWVSNEVGIMKPDRGIFLLAAQALGEKPCNCLYIGDNEQDDLVGATAAGMRVRLVNTVLNAERLAVLLNQEGVL